MTNTEFDDLCEKIKKKKFFDKDLEAIVFYAIGLRMELIRLIDILDRWEQEWRIIVGLDDDQFWNSNV